MSAVECHEVSKTYRLARGQARLWKDAVLGGRGTRGRLDHVVALRDVSFAVGAGRTFGIVGPNGAGKSTLLKLIGGVTQADSGRVLARGRVGSLLELGAGFHPDLTGRENAMLTGVISGLRRAEVRRRMGEIIAFAELEGFIDEPLRTYSSGMKARLAFSTAAQVDADIMLVDEVLAVGDLAFQRRCVARMRALRDGGVTIVLVSHDLDLVRLLCDDALWLEDGRVLAVGPADRVVGAYTASASGGRARGVARENDRPCTPGTGVRIARVHLLDGRGHEADVLCSGDPLTVAIDIERVTREPVNVSVHVRPARGAVVLDTSAVVQGPCARLEIERLDLAPGAYAVDVRVFSEDWLALLDGAAPAPLSVWGRGSTDSVLLPPLVWRTAPDR